MRKIYKKIVAIIIIAICAVMTCNYSTVFGAKTQTDGVDLCNDDTNEDYTQSAIIDIDPDIQVVVTILPDDYVPQTTYDLRKTTTTFKYYHSFVGQWRYYKGNHFSVDGTSTSTNDGNFTLSLHRYDGDSSSPGVIVKQVTLPQNGSFHVEFLNVNKPGTYALGFQQPLFHWGDQSGDLIIWDWD